MTRWGQTGLVSRYSARSSPAAARLSPLGPGGRPFARWRPAAVLLSAAALFVSSVLLLSDSAPGLLHRLSKRIDVGSSRAAKLVSETRPQSDFEIHVLVWAVVMTLIGLAMWSNRSLLISAVAVLITSVLAERAQYVLTQTRSMQITDLVANVIGVLAGLGLVCGLAILMRWRDPI